MNRGKDLFLYVFIIPLLILVTTSCSHKNKYIIPEKKFVKVLVDMHLAEAIGAESKSRLNTEYKIDSASLYGSVFRKHDIDMAIFDSTMMFYSRRPDKFQKIYNQVTAELKRIEADVNREQDEEDRQVGSIIWSSDSVYNISQGSTRVNIDIPIKDTGIYIVSAVVKVLPPDESLDPRMSVYFFRENKSGKGEKLPFSEVRYTSRNGEDRVFRSAKRLSDTTYTRLKGAIANYSNGDTLFIRKMVIKKLTVSFRH